MTDQTIIDDAKANAGKQEQEPVAWMNGNLEYHDLVTNADKNNMFHANYAFYQKHLTIPLFTAPPQPQTVADALEMAAKIAESAPTLTYFQRETDYQIANYIVKEIRNLITTQPTQMQIPDGYKLVPVKLSLNSSSIRKVLTDYFEKARTGQCFLFDDFWIDVINATQAAPSIQGNAEGEK